MQEGYQKVLGVGEVEVAMDAGRVCDAIAKIGYMPVAAIMDIVDNSVTAGASIVKIQVDWDNDNLLYHNKNNILSYRIIDNGKGMTESDIGKALQLGSDVIYGGNSLSKYGMGLKSAGLSLGTRISVSSKISGVWQKKGVLDSNRIKETRRWIISFEEISQTEVERYEESLPDSESGTIVEISGCQSINHDSAKRTIAGLEKRLGVVYQFFLSRPQSPLSISIEPSEVDEIKISATDLLFIEKTPNSAFDPDNYDMLTPIKTLSTEINLTGREDDPKAYLEVVIFPQHQMSSYVDFSKEQRDQVKSYDINRENKGFFIYRNDRLIRWGDSLDGLVDRDLLGFRARLKVYTAHDDILHVDVSKQNLVIPEDILEDIKRLITLSKRAAKQAFEICSNALRTPEHEGNTFNEKNDSLSEEDPYEDDSQEDRQRVKERRKKLTEETKKKLEEAKEPLPSEKESESPSVAFEKIRYSSNVASDLLWEAHHDQIGGTFVRINKNHQFYSSIMVKMGHGSPERQALEAIIWTAAAAEVATLEKEKDEIAVLERILRMYKKRLSFNLDNWVHNNQDIYR